MNSSLKYIITILAAGAAVMYGCSGGGDGTDPAPPDGDRDRIAFNGTTETDGVSTRAPGDFPNTTIGVSATYAGLPGDWRNYGDIINEKATVETESGGVYGFEWDNTKYWPFDGSSLIFSAYSPHTSQAPGVLTLDYDLIRLYITLAAGMPDVMYASGNREFNPYSKADITADLGEFRHAMSKLTVVVTADDENFNTDVLLAGITVSTGKGKATLDLLSDGDLDFGGGIPFSYELVASPVSFSASSPYSRTVYLFPGTEEDTKVTIRLDDSVYPFERTYNLTDITYDGPDGKPGTEPLSLLRARNTTLTITVSGTTVQQPNEDIRLKGQLTDWIDNGELLVTIN